MHRARPVRWGSVNMPALFGVVLERHDGEAECFGDSYCCRHNPGGANDRSDHDEDVLSVLERDARFRRGTNVSEIGRGRSVNRDECREADQQQCVPGRSHRSIDTAVIAASVSSTGISSGIRGVIPAPLSDEWLCDVAS